MITLILLHPFQTIPVQSWSFEDESAIRIGRATDNHVMLYSAVVSRHHVELRRRGTKWEIVNLGTNGTYVNGKPISQMPLEDGMIIHLARSGPKIQIRLGKKAVEELHRLSAEETMAQQVKGHLPATEAIAEEETATVPFNLQEKALEKDRLPRTEAPL